MNNKAQMQLIEVVLTAVMIFLALYFVKILDFPTQTDIVKEDTLQSYGDSVLESLASLPDDETGEYNSLLAYYTDLSSLRSFVYIEFKNDIDNRLPEDIIYKVFKLNISKLYDNPDESLENCKTDLITPTYWVNEESRSSRIVVINGFVYEVVLCMFFNVGG